MENPSNHVAKLLHESLQETAVFHVGFISTVLARMTFLSVFKKRVPLQIYTALNEKTHTVNCFQLLKTIL